MYDIADYYIIGDLHSAALVSREASIDWLCLPHFDSPSIFARMLDEIGGSFSVDKTGYKVKSQYIDKTAIVAFDYKSRSSEFSLHDFMVPQPKNSCEEHFLVRKFRGKRGNSKVKLFLSPKAHYAREEFVRDPGLEHTISNIPENLPIEPRIVLKTHSATIITFLPKEAAVEFANGQYTIEFEVPEGQTRSVILTYADEKEKRVYKEFALEQETQKFWEDWVAKGKFFDFSRDKLIRSAITLKLMQFYPTGALIAAPTTSLPEEIGGTRNWDYRYVWIRDATFTLYAFSVLGYFDEAEKFFEFIQKITEESADDDFDVSLMYTIEGKPVPTEKTLDYLAGYKLSAPVRIGNGAKEQFQLDVYGALIDAHYFIGKYFKERDEIHIKLITRLIGKIEQMWQKKDRGIWEVRSGDEHFTYSKVMAWVGLDRAAKLLGMLKKNPELQQKCRTLAKEVEEWIWKYCYNRRLQSFVQYPRTQRQDATNFLFVLLHFLDKRDPRTRKIIEQTCRELCFSDFFVYRYFSDDGLPKGEGAFLLCSFWYISALAIIGDLKKAKDLFAKIESHMNPQGLLSEEIDVRTKEYLGNYPQAFSHLGYIMSAYYIHHYSKVINRPSRKSSNKK